MTYSATIKLHFAATILSLQTLFLYPKSYRLPDYCAAQDRKQRPFCKNKLSNYY